MKREDDMENSKSNKEKNQFLENYVGRYFSQFFYSVTALDVGSGPSSHDNRRLFRSSFVIGTDVQAWPNVDLICSARNLAFRDGFFDTIVSTDWFNYDPDWQLSMLNVFRMLKKGGMFAFTCRQHDGIAAGDFQKFLFTHNLDRQLAAYACYVDTINDDLCFVGFKRTESPATDNHIIMPSYVGLGVTRYPRCRVECQPIHDNHVVHVVD